MLLKVPLRLHTEFKDRVDVMISVQLSLAGSGAGTSECYLRFVEMNSELMHEWRDRNAPNFSGKYGLFNGEQRGRQSLDAQILQLAACLQTLPGSGDLDAESRQIEARVQPVAEIGDACSA